MSHVINDRADAAQAETTLPVRNNGLSEFGKDIVREMNRIGMFVDLAHVSSKTMSDALDVARAPVSIRSKASLLSGPYSSLQCYNCVTPAQHGHVHSGI